MSGLIYNLKAHSISSYQPYMTQLYTRDLYNIIFELDYYRISNQADREPYKHVEP